MFESEAKLYLYNKLYIILLKTEKTFQQHAESPIDKDPRLRTWLYTHQNSDNSKHNTSHVIFQLPVTQCAIQSMNWVPCCQLSCAQKDKKKKTIRSHKLVFLTNRKVRDNASNIKATPFLEIQRFGFYYHMN